MNPLIKIMPNIKKYNDYIFDVKTGKNPMMISGLTDLGKVQMAYSTHFYAEKPICIITYNELQAKKMIKDLNFFGEKIEYFPKREIANFDYAVESKEILFERIGVLNNIVKNNSKIIVTTIEAVMQKMISKDALYKNMTKLKVGDSVDLENLKEKLINLGYERYDLVEGICQFSIRGGIIDIATSEKDGIRIELWGDEIDSIRKFSIMSQRTTEMINEIEILPAYEFLIESNLDKVCENISNKKFSTIIAKKVEEDIEEIKNENYINKIDRYFDCFYEKTDNLLDYLSDDFIIFIDENEKIKNRAENIKKDNENLRKDLIEKNKIVSSLLICEENYLDFIKKSELKQTIYLEKQDMGFVDKQSMHAKRNGYSFSYREVNFFRSSLDLLFQKLQKAISTGKQTIILRRRR